MQWLGTRNGILLFLVGLILVWFGGYYVIGLLSSEEWSRYLNQLYFSRFTLVVALICMFYASIPHVKNFIHNTHKTATDLAVFRILFFGFFAIGSLIYPSGVSDQVLPFIDLPQSAQVPMPFMGWYPKIVPINASLVQIATVLFTISIFTSLLGFKTRWSILVFTVTLFYLFAIPNLYGKINHSHHMMWIPAILIFSPCADRFSLDAYFRKRKNKVIRHSNHAYSLPFLLIWAVIGLIYFFPGFWKMWSNGMDWFMTDNVRNQMYQKWFSLGDWLPVFRIDLYPFLYKTSGLFTVIFELFFIPLLLNKSTRKLGIFMGLLFHLGTHLFMNIFFIVLVLTYFSFVDWHKIPFLRERNVPSLPTSQTSSPMVKWIGMALIFSCILFGFGKWNSWPFTVYPTFDSLVEVERNHLIYEGISTSGKRMELPVDLLKQAYSSERYWQIEYEIVESQKKNSLDTVLLNHFAAIYSEKFKNLETVEIYTEKQSILPEKKTRTEKQLIYTKKSDRPRK